MASRDYARKRSTSRKPEGRPVPAAFWLLSGLLIGVLAAFAFNHYQAERPGGAEAPRSAPPPEVTVTTPPAPPPPAAEPVRPRFDFYTILPEMEVAVPQTDTRARRDLSVQDTPAGLAPVEEPGTYLLQAGSFRRAEEADRLRASLALLGIESSVQTVTIDERDTWHRVRVGPYQELERLNAVRSRLKENGIDTVVLNVRN